MDKRWFIIILILILGLTALFFITEASTKVGSANVDLDNFRLTVPDSYNVDKNVDHLVRLINRKTGETITIENLGKTSTIDKEMVKKMGKLEMNPNITVMENTTFKTDSGVLPIIYFEKSPNNTVNQVAFITKFNHTYSLESSNFKDNSTIKKDIELIIDSLERDPKQKQD